MDYKIEDKGEGFKNYIILSEKLRADLRRFENEQNVGNIVTEQTGKVTWENLKEGTRKMKEENEKHRQKFITENNPPQLNGAFLTPKDKL
ncbi:MAG: hypothetical protein NY202_04250 [Mollicutes bacterium UO1]